MLQMSKAVTETRDLVNSLRVVIGRLGQVDSFSKGEVSFVKPSGAIEVAVSNLMMRAWHPVLVLSHFFGIHLQSSIGGVFVLVSSWNFPH